MVERMCDRFPIVLLDSKELLSLSLRRSMRKVRYFEGERDTIPQKQKRRSKL
jgi:hypothetical protein